MQYYLSKHGMVWQHIRTGKVLGNKLELKPGERITDYKQINKPKGQLQEARPKKQDKKSFPFTEADSKKNDKGVF